MSQWTDSQQQELFALIDALFEGDLDAGGGQRLEELIRTHEIARQRYVERLNLRATLHWRLAGAGALARSAADDADQHGSPASRPGTLAPLSGSIPKPSFFDFLAACVRPAVALVRRPTPFSVLVASIVAPLMLLALLYVVAPQALNFRMDSGGASQQQAHVARLAHTHNARWFATAPTISDGTRLQPGQTIHLVEGLAEVVFDNGATVLVQGPVKFSVEGSDAGSLDLGALMANVPPRATGFTVVTETATIVDLGTRFRAEVTSLGEAQVVVDKGTVELRANTGGAAPARRLTAGEGARVTRSGKVLGLGRDDRAVVGRPGKLPDHVPLSERPLVNGGFEQTQNTRGKFPRRAGDWYGERARIVGAENDIVPCEGSRMYRFLNADPAGAGRTAGAELFQAIDLQPYADAVRDGRVRARLMARFNRVAGDAQTDTQFRTILYALNKPLTGTSADIKKGTGVTNIGWQKVDTDADPSTWESVTVAAKVPPNTRILMVQLHAGENVFNDLRGTEFDGHYADAVRLELMIDPPQRAGDGDTTENESRDGRP